MTVMVRNHRQEDFAGIIDLCRRVYPASPPWKEEQLASHLRIFPEGQFVAVDEGKVVGMAASLIVDWDDYEMGSSWRDFTDHGMFTNHNPVSGRTLYAAEVMVDPTCQGSGVGTKIYAARTELAQRLRLRRIRAGARLRGYHSHADRMAPADYLEKVARGELSDPTLTFQLRRGFRVLDLIPNYLRNDPESLGYAACIEWINPKEARPDDRVAGDPRYRVEYRPTPKE